MNVSESLLHALRDHGVREIFGIPGDFALPFFGEMERTAILPLYTLSHEPAVGFAADGAARLRCAPAAAAVTYGAGALNMVNAVAAAYAEKSPVVVISAGPGGGEAKSGLLLHHQARSIDSQYQIYTEVTCDQARLDDPARAPIDIARVLRHCASYSQPVYIEIPRDMAVEPCAPVVAAPPLPYDQDALDACVEEILARLRSAQSPMLMVGVEVRRFNLELRVAELARRLGLPVVTSFMGRGLLADAPAPLLGTYVGVAGTPEVTQRVEHADALFLLGVILSDTNFGVSERSIDLRHTIQALDRRVTLGYHSYANIPIDALVEELLRRVPVVSTHFEVTKPSYPRDMPADEAPISPTDIATAVNDLMASHGRMPMASDVGDCLFTAMDIANTALVAPGYYATMGFGVPAGLGVQAATGERPLILVGDGAFQMTGWELGNARR